MATFRNSIALSTILSLFIGYWQTAKAQTDSIQVVFHVLHHGGIENIADSQIVDAVRILNLDFNKLNADTADVVTAFKNIIGNANIQFKLASKDPQGNPTTGIDKIYTSYTTAPVVDSFYLNQWNPSKYLNIWVVKGGPIQIPETPRPAVADSFPEKDGIVIMHNFVGSIGTGKPYTSRALTHEVGHYLNLMHTWGEANFMPGLTCGDDSVSDTPITKGANSNCNLQKQECNLGTIENVQNFMDYSYCTRMFTKGQVDRMNNCLNSSVANRDKLRQSGGTNIFHIADNKQLFVSPNPFNKSINIKGLAEGDYQILIIDITGRIMSSYNKAKVLGNTINLDVENISAQGLYFVNISGKNVNHTLKIYRE